MSIKCRHQYPYSFTWTIENIILCPLRPGEKLCSPPFIAETLENTKWRLVLYPRGTKNLSYMSLFLQRQAGSTSTKEIIVNFKLFMDSFVPRFRCLKTCHNICFRENELAGFSEFARLKTLHLLEDSSPKGIFTIRCELAASDENARDATWNKRTDLKRLSQNLQRLFESKIHYDIILRCENLEFYAHKAILASRSPKLVLGLDPHSCSNDIIKQNIYTMSAPILKTILIFLYTGKLDIPPKIAPQLIFAVAEEYELRELWQKMLTSSKSFQARTVLEVEHKFLIWNVRITGENQSDAMSYFRILSCETVYVDKLVISCKITLDFDDESSNIAAISFRLKGVDSERPVFLMCNLHYHVADDMATDVFAGLHLFGNEEEWQEIFPLSDMHLVPDQFLYLKFEIDMCDGTHFSYFHEKLTYPETCPFGTNDFNKLSLDFGKLLSTEIFSDFAVKCGEETFAVHKAILSARSPVFEKMLKHDMAEKRTGFVVIPDIRSNVMKLMLKYMYSGSIENLTHDEMCDLYEAADKYEIIILKEKCASLLIQNLNVGTAPEILGLADMHFDSFLKLRAKNYIQKHDIQVSTLATTSSTTSISLSTEPLNLPIQRPN